MEVGTSDPFPCWDNVPTLDTFFFEGFPKVIRFFLCCIGLKLVMMHIATCGYFSNSKTKHLWFYLTHRNGSVHAAINRTCRSYDYIQVKIQIPL